MNAIKLLFILGAITFSSISHAQFILTLHCQQMDPYLGKTFLARVSEVNSGKEVGRKTIASIQAADFSIDLYVLFPERNYNIDFYVDVNANDDYDPPPTDHAWRQTINNPTQNTTITFIPDSNFFNIGLPDPFPYSTYDAVWGGKWMNLTFGSTDTIEASLNLTCDSIFGFFTTSGVFGNPAPVVFNYANALPPDSVPADDTIRFSLDPPWTGEIYSINGEIHGALNLMGIGLNFIGTLGAKQILCHYTVIVGGNPFANGYFYLRELQINNSSPELAIELTTNSEVSCYNGNDGFLSTIGEGGTPGYTYLWSTGDTTSLLSNIGAGDFSLTVTDANGCNVEAVYSVGQPSQLLISSLVLEAQCYEICDGLIDVTVTGGTPPYTYAWSDGTTFEDQINLCAGTWELTVFDAAGCTAVLNATVHEPEPLIVDVLVTPVSCLGACDGIVKLDVTGGTPPYQFNIPPLCVGTYTIFVIDANGCLFTTEVIIFSKPKLIFENITIENETNDQSNGVITIVAGGGTPPFSYSLNGTPFQSSNIFSGLAAGNYVVTIKDVNGCIAESEVEVLNIITEAVNELHVNFTLYPNPATSSLHVEADVPLTIEIFDVHGHMIRQSEKSISHQIPVKDIEVGLYLMRISDGTGVTYRKVVVE